MENCDKLERDLSSLELRVAARLSLVNILLVSNPDDFQLKRERLELINLQQKVQFLRTQERYRQLRHERQMREEKYYNNLPPLGQVAVGLGYIAGFICGAVVKYLNKSKK